VLSKLPLAFLSYAHFDDEHEGGKLRLLAERLSGEVRLQSGHEFPIFIDRKDLKWGQQWRSRIDESLDGATFLIPILTPSYFKSDYCRKELLYFFSREAELQRGDLVMPIYYVRCRELDDEDARAADDLALRLHERQYKDWRRFRHESWKGPEIGRQLENMATEIVEALERARGLEALPGGAKVAPARNDAPAPMPLTAEKLVAGDLDAALKAGATAVKPGAAHGVSAVATLSDLRAAQPGFATEPVVKHLAAFIGPIAKIVVSRLVKQYDDLDLVYAEAAKQIDSELERRRFMETRPW